MVATGSTRLEGAQMTTATCLLCNTAIAPRRVVFGRATIMLKVCQCKAARITSRGPISPRRRRRTTRRAA